MGGSRKGKLQKYCNKLIVFLTSGLWHGASLSFVIWGGLNGIYQIAGDVIQPIRDKAIKILGLNRNSLGHKLIQIIGTFFLVDFTWIFFRAGSTHKAIQIIRMMFSIRNPWILFDGSLYQCGLDIKNFWLMIFCIVILLCVDIAKRKGICIRKIILNQDYWVRWLVIDTAIIILLVFGMWGSTYEAANFIYFQF